jgi:hypothetical protein
MVQTGMAATGKERWKIWPDGDGSSSQPRGIHMRNNECENVMKPILPLIALLLATPVLAQDGPGSHFLSSWDLDGDGSVTLAEATERRGDVFTTFDADGDGSLTAAEYDAFDEARAAHMAEMPGNGGKGKGNPEEQGMMRGFSDANADGAVSREEFMAKVPDWFAMMDRNADGAVTKADFGQGN